MFLNALKYKLQIALVGTIFLEYTTIKEIQLHITTVLNNL
jgi:hypothetical protein